MEDSTEEQAQGAGTNEQGTWIDKGEEMEEISEGRRKAKQKAMRNPELRDFLPPYSQD